MNRNLTLFLLFSFWVLVCHAQVNVDSLKMEFYSVSIEKQDRISTAEKIARFYLPSQPDSARFYIQAGLELTEEDNDQSALFKFYSILGTTELMQQNLEEAAINYTKALEKIDYLEDQSESYSVFINLGYLYDIQNQYAKAWKLYHEAISLVAQTLDEDELRFSPASAYNNIASIYIDQDKPDSALIFLNIAWNYPGSHEDAYGEQIMAANYVEIFLAQNRPDSVSKYLTIQKQDLVILEKSFNGSLDFQYAKYYSQLGESQYKNQQNKPALLSFEKALTHCIALDEYEMRTSVLKYLAEISEERGEVKTALGFQKQYVVSLDSLNERAAGDEIMRLKARHDLDTELLQSRNQVEKLSYEKERKEMTILVIVIVSVFLILILLLLYFWQHNRHRRLKSEEAIQRLEKEKVKKELDYKKKEMTANGMYLAQKNNLISLVSKKLQELTPTLRVEDAKKIKAIIDELGTKAHDKTWDEFEKRFNEVHTDFYQRLSKKYPKLTAGELRLSGFLRLNMTNKEIAAITYQNVETIKTARY
ncbi:MAG: tetratricopeptide repeat protein, partial [Calditrichaceae bacterium]